MMKSPMALEQCKVLEAGLALGPEVDFDFGLLLLHDYTWSISGITPFHIYQSRTTLLISELIAIFSLCVASFPLAFSV